MTSPKPWLQEGATPFERSLLRSAEDDRPSAGLENKVMAGLVGASALSAAGTLAQSTSATTATTATSATAKAGAAKLGVGAIQGAGLATQFSLAKLATVTALGAATAIGGYALSRHAVEPVVSPPAPASEQVPARSNPTESQQQPEGVVPPANERLPSQGQTDLGAPRKKSKQLEENPAQSRGQNRGNGAQQNNGAQQKGKNADSIAKELQSLDQARTLIRGGQPAQGLKQLRTHRQQFRGGVLGPEAQVLEIEALAKSGQSSAARTRGQAFLKRHKHGFHAQRVRQILDGL